MSELKRTCSLTDCYKLTALTQLFFLLISLRLYRVLFCSLQLVDVRNMDVVASVAAHRGAARDVDFNPNRHHTVLSTQY